MRDDFFRKDKGETSKIQGPKQEDSSLKEMRRVRLRLVEHKRRRSASMPLPARDTQQSQTICTKKAQRKLLYGYQVKLFVVVLTRSVSPDNKQLRSICKTWNENSERITRDAKGNETTFRTDGLIDGL